MIHVYTGDGKGKTTAAMGLAVRCRGTGGKAAVFQFLKGGPTGELQSLSALDVPVVRLSRQYGFFRTLDEKEREELIDEQNGILRRVLQCLGEKRYELIILDEAVGAYNIGALDKELLMDVIRAAGKTELVLTGRNAPEEILAEADYITEMKCIRHPFEKGIPAREGIEY